MNKKAQLDIIFYILIAVMITVIFFNFSKDYSGNESFFREIALNEIKLTKDTMESFQGNAIYRFNLNISKYDLKIDRSIVSLDAEKINFLSPSLTEQIYGKTEELYFIKNFEGFALESFEPENSIKSLSYVNVLVNLPKFINFVNLDPDNPKLDLIQKELTRSFEAKTGFKVNIDSPDAVTIFLKSTRREKNIALASFSFDKSDETRALSRKLGVLILNEFVKQSGLDVNIKPVKADADLNQKNTAIILEIENNFIEKNAVSIPAHIETGIEAFFR